MATNSDFALAVGENAVSSVRKFLRQGESPDDYVFFLAIRYNANAVLRVLIKAGANLNAVEHPKCSGYTPLMRAIAAKNMQAFRMLLKAGALIDKRGSYEMPLHLAAELGSGDFIRACIAAGAKIDVRDGGGKTPLMTAAHFGQIGIVELLLKAGASLRNRDRFGRTPSEIAADSGEEKVVELLKGTSFPRKKQRRRFSPN